MLRWVKDHLWLIVIVALGVLAFTAAVAMRHKGRPDLKGLWKDLKREKEIIDGKRKVAKMVARDGHEATTKTIKDLYRRKIKDMDDDQKKKVDELAGDPEALLDHLFHIS